MIAIIDYGMGNLRSVEKAVNALGRCARITRNVDELAFASHIILPGVGAFGDAMARLEQLQIADAIRDAAASGTPLLGICLGMQLLLDESFEYGEHAGLGLISGRVVPFEGQKMTGLRIPHIGWNDIEPIAGMFLDEIKDPYMYFVHSFFADGVDSQDSAAFCSYGQRFVCAVQRENVWGTQFHPEKSGPTGLTILERFLSSADGDC